VCVGATDVARCNQNNVSTADFGGIFKSRSSQKNMSIKHRQGGDVHCTPRADLTDVSIGEIVFTIDEAEIYPIGSPCRNPTNVHFIYSTSQIDT